MPGHLAPQERQGQGYQVLRGSDIEFFLANANEKRAMNRLHEVHRIQRRPKRRPQKHPRYHPESGFILPAKLVHRLRIVLASTIQKHGKRWGG